MALTITTLLVYVLGTTRLAALLIHPAAWAMPRGTRLFLVDNPIPGQPHGRMWAFIGDLVLSVFGLVPLVLFVLDSGQYPLVAVAWSLATVAWTVVIVVLSVRTRSRYTRGGGSGSSDRA